MKKYVYILILLCSCDIMETGHEIDPILLPYFLEFREEAQRRGVELEYRRLVMRIGSVDGDAKGVCRSKLNGRFEIVIESDLMDHVYYELPYRFEEIVFHELGHALLDRGHTEERSIMRASASEDYDYSEETKEYYLNELFK